MLNIDQIVPAVNDALRGVVVLLGIYGLVLAFTYEDYPNLFLTLIRRKR